MRSQEVTWATHSTVVLHGRNGTGLCAGLQIAEAGAKVTLTPITSRNKLANCHIDVPVDRLAEVIDALRQMLPRAVRKLS